MQLGMLGMQYVLVSEYHPKTMLYFDTVQYAALHAQFSLLHVCTMIG